MTKERTGISRRTALGSIAIGALAAPYVAKAQIAARRGRIMDASEFTVTRLVNTDEARTRGPMYELVTGMHFTEGPVWYGDQRQLIFSDIADNRLYRWDAANEELEVFRDPSGHVNGNTLDFQGRLISCQQQFRRVIRTEHSGEITVIADSWDGKKLNTPNDVVVRKTDGSIWFTDPTNGLFNDWEGRRGEQEQDGTYVYRVDGETGEIHPVIRDVRPNGLCFNEDSTKLYVVNNAPTPREIRVYDITADGQNVENGRLFAEGGADGMKCDFVGNVWAASGGVKVFSPAGEQLLQIVLPENPANLCFGGPIGNILYMTARTHLYSTFTNTRGANMI